MSREYHISKAAVGLASVGALVLSGCNSGSEVVHAPTTIETSADLTQPSAEVTDVSGVMVKQLKIQKFVVNSITSVNAIPIMVDVELPQGNGKITTVAIFDVKTPVEIDIIIDGRGPGPYSDPAAIPVKYC